MMGNSKTVFKYFTIPQYRQEEDYLSAMNEKGWCFTHVTFPGFYHFEKSEPEQVTYRLDYNQEGIRNKAEYVQMFSDCGWEYICDFVGYSYFRKEGEVGEEREEIFCDDASRLDMMRRVFRGRIILLAGGDANDFHYAYDYIFWTMILGAVPTVGNVLCGHLVRSIGASREAGFGMSMGGTSALMAAGEPLPDTLRGIIADSAFTSPKAILEHVTRNNLHLPFGSKAAEAAFRRKLGMAADACSTVEVLKRCRIPVLLVHGGKDRFVPADMAFENYRACAGPRRLFVVPGADHVGCWFTDGEGYRRALTDLWREYDHAPESETRTEAAGPV